MFSRSLFDEYSTWLRQLHFGDNKRLKVEKIELLLLYYFIVDLKSVFVYYLKK